LIWGVALSGAAACLYTMKGLPTQAWERFGVWLGLGTLIYLVYGYRRSKLHQGRRR
jgi:APA family basic amino acid/polyamine antiporter